MDIVTAIYLLVGAALLALLYLNLATSLIVLLNHSIAPGTKAARLLIVWLLPVIGFALTLRFSEQANEGQVHRWLIPGVIARWVYTTENRKPNPIRDERERRSGWGR